MSTTLESVQLRSVELKSRTIKIFLIAVFCLITLSAFTAWNKPAIGYETSIYLSTPLLFWAIIISVMIFSTALILYYLSYKKIKISNYTWLLLLAVYLCYVLVNSLFIIRSYYMWNMTGDGATHLGWIFELMSEGHIPDDLFYPSLHIFLSESAYITQINLTVLHKLVPVIFGALFVPFMFIFARSIFPKEHPAPLLVALFSCWFILPCTLLAPNIDSNLIIPVMLAIFVMVFQDRSPRNVILLLLMLFYVVISHPITAFIFGLMIFATIVPQLFRDRDGSYSKLNIILILSVWYLFWYLRFQYFETTLGHMYDSITQMAAGQYEVIGQAIDNASAVGNNPIVEIIKRYGQDMSVILLSSFGIITLFRYHSQERLRTLGSFAFPFLAIVVFMIVSVASMGFTMATRYLSYVTILGIPFVAYFTTCLFKWKAKKRNVPSIIATTLVVGVLFATMISGFLSVYPSPYNGTASYQSTQMSVDGMGWFFGHRDVGTPVVGITVAPGRYADLLLSPDEQKEQNLPNYMYLERSDGTMDDRRPPYHFGYSNNSVLGSFYSEEQILITNTKDIVQYSEIRPELGALYWEPTDFEKLLYDPTVGKIYSNSEYTMWNIYPY